MVTYLYNSKQWSIFARPFHYPSNALMIHQHIASTTLPFHPGVPLKAVWPSQNQITVYSSRTNTWMLHLVWNVGVLATICSNPFWKYSTNNPPVGSGDSEKWMNGPIWPTGSRDGQKSWFLAVAFTNASSRVVYPHYQREILDRHCPHITIMLMILPGIWTFIGFIGLFVL